MDKFKKSMKKMFGSASSRYGTHSTLLIVLVIVLVVAANFGASKLPERFKNIDLSETHLYDISDVSVELLKGLDKKIDILILADKDATDERIRIFVEKYAGLSSKVKVKWINPSLHPEALEENDAEEDTIIVSCADTEKKTTISFDDIIIYEQSYYSSSEKEFDAEGQLTSAINYVISGASKIVYSVTGHGELEASDMLQNMMKKSGFSIQEINTLMEKEIPADCDLLFFYAPSKDLTEDEKNMVSAYLQKGGKVTLILGKTVDGMTNLTGLMKEYGMEVVDGYIADTKRCYQQNPYYIFPELSVSGEMSNGMESGMVLLVNALGMKETDPARETITVTGLMQTSEYGFAVTEGKQEQGTYLLGAVAQEDKARFTVFTAFTMIDESLVQTFSTLENMTLFMNSVSANFEKMTNISISPKSLDVTYNTMQHVGLFTFIFVVIVPIVILIYGFVRWLKRRKA